MQLILKGNKKEVDKMLDNLIKKFPSKTIKEVINAYNTKTLILC
jgi:hypothetical protein